jgi:hypothetical protein
MEAIIQSLYKPNQAHEIIVFLRFLREIATFASLIRNDEFLFKTNPPTKSPTQKKGKALKVNKSSQKMSIH